MQLTANSQHHVSCNALSGAGDWQHFRITHENEQAPTGNALYSNAKQKDQKHSKI